MPAKSIKQMRWIRYLRDKYKSKDKTPDKWKFIWDKDWEKLEPVNESVEEKPKNDIIEKLSQHLDRI